MSVDILSTLSFLINLGLEIKARLDSLDQAAEDLGLLTANLRLLQGVFENPVNGDIVKANLSEFVSILDVLQSIANSCKECAKALDTDLAGAKSAAEKTKRVFKRIWNFGKIPELLAEIQRKAEQLQKIYSAVQAVLLQDIRAQQERATGKEIVKSTPYVGNSVLHGNLLSLDLSTDFASIDQLVGGLMDECKHLQQRLQETILSPDTSAVQQYQTLNPEGASFWRDRFQKDELGVSALRYEVKMLKASYSQY